MLDEIGDIKNVPAFIEGVKNREKLAMGYPTDYFTVLFALGRLPGCLAQWEEMLSDSEQKIARPRQIYTGYDERDFVPLAQRQLAVAD